MKIMIRSLIPGFASAALGACGGGGGGGAPVASIPPAPVATPTPTPTPSTGWGATTAANYIVAATGANQQFASKGGYVSSDPVTGQPRSPTTTEGQQLNVRYNSGTSQYEIQLPASSFWEGLYLTTSSSPNTRDFRTSGVVSGNSPTFVQLQEFSGTGYTHSALALWSTADAQGETSGAIAFGIPTPPGAVPVSGSAAFNGSISGRSTETSFDTLTVGYWTAIVEGSIGLSFDFKAGSLSGSISPTIYNLSRRALTPMTFVNTVHSSGATAFSGAFSTSLPGANSFSGLFTGPTAQELMGSFAFPYRSPDDGKVYQANGAFVAKQ